MKVAAEKLRIEIDCWQYWQGDSIWLTDCPEEVYQQAVSDLGSPAEARAFLRDESQCLMPRWFKLVRSVHELPQLTIGDTIAAARESFGVDLCRVVIL